MHHSYATANTHDAEISWSQNDIDELRVSFDGENRRMNVDGTQQVLAGLPAQTDIQLQLFTDLTERCSVTFSTGGLPPELPWIVQDQINGTPAWTGLIGTTMGEESATWMLDTLGVSDGIPQWKMIESSATSTARTPTFGTTLRTQMPKPQTAS